MKNLKNSKTIAEVAYQYCMNNNVRSISCDNIDILNAIATKSKMINCNSSTRHLRILASIEKRTDLFRKDYLRTAKLKRIFYIKDEK